MAEIHMERRPQRFFWRWVVLLLVLIGIGVGIWLLWGTRAPYSAAPPAAEITPAPGSAGAKVPATPPVRTYPGTGPASGEVSPAESAGINIPATGTPAAPGTQSVLGPRTSPEGAAGPVSPADTGGAPSP